MNLKNTQGLGFKIASGILIIINLIVGFIIYSRLPDQVPSHWNAAGEVDGYMGPLGGAFFLPLLTIGMFILFWVLPKIDPKKKNYEQMEKVYWLISFVLIAFLSALYWGTIAVALEYLETLPSLIFSSIGLIFVILGNYFGKIKYNYTLGIRTPWTLANEEIWYKTHRFAGPIWMIGGVLAFLAGFLPSAWTFKVFITVIVIITILPIGYSFLQFRKISM